MKFTPSESADELRIGCLCMDMIYMSPDSYHDALDELIDLGQVDLDKHQTAGLLFIPKNGQVIQAHMLPGTPRANIPRWRTQLRGAWLIKIGDSTITSIDDTWKAFQKLVNEGASLAILLFAHPEVRPDISRWGIPIVLSIPFSKLTHTQLNDHWEFALGLLANLK